MTGFRPLQYAGLSLLALIGLLAMLLYQRATLLITETQIIEKFAARYLEANQRGKLSHCRARAGEAFRVRMIVICGPEPFEASQHYEYHIGPLGGLVAGYGPEDWATRMPVGGREQI